MIEKNAIHKPEIMSPAGHWPQLQAAIEAGADSVYFGLNHFTARAKVGFTLTELPAVMQTLHQRGVKGYVTFNTLVFDHELREAAQTIAAIAEAGADSIIVQDVGIAQLAKQIAPDLEVHGSTQMSITSMEGVDLAQSFGASRVVLARELSLKEIQIIRSQTDCELEMFVHGALCVSYSGQCFSSEAWGGRSANRGQCAQACRLPYELIVDDKLTPLGDARYLLSPGDLYALRQMPEIVQIGISALKIEGRYKDANYVAMTTQAYRQAVDEAWKGLPLSITQREESQLEQVYSRGSAPYFVTGVDHQSVVRGRAPRHRGLLMGRVLEVKEGRVTIDADPNAKIASLKPGDGVVFDAADWRSPGEPEEGGRIYHLIPEHNNKPDTQFNREKITLEFGNGQINYSRIRPGDLMWRTHDPELDKQNKPLTQAKKPVHKQKVQVHVQARVGEPLVIRWQLHKAPSCMVTVQSDESLVEASNHGLTVEFARKQLGRLGNTAYELGALTLDGEGRSFVPSSLLNHLRREAVDQLIGLQSQPKPVQIHNPQEVLGRSLTTSSVRKFMGVASEMPAEQMTEANQLHLLVRTPEQLEAACGLAPASITLDYLDLYGLRPAVEQVKESGITARIASPRILKPSEQGIIKFLLKLNCQILVRSGGLLRALQAAEHPPLIGDFSLNAANILSAETFMNLGLHRLTPTHDLNAEQIRDLAKTIGAGQLEVIAYQHLPVFHMEHCVFCRFLSDGTSYKNCGKPCETHRVALRDVQGRTHPVMADVGCRNTVFGAEAQESSKHLGMWTRANIRHYRLEFTHESADEVRTVTQAFQQALASQMSFSMLTERLGQLAPQGITEGSLFVPKDYLSMPSL